VWSLAQPNGGNRNSSKHEVEVVVELTNAGSLAGRQTALLFWRPTGSAHALRHVRQKLVGYVGTGSTVAPGESRSLRFPIEPGMLAMHQGDSEEAAVFQGEYELFVTVGGSETTPLTRTLRVVA
jgi:hypothetical protein